MIKLLRKIWEFVMRILGDKGNDVSRLSRKMPKKIARESDTGYYEAKRFLDKYCDSLAALFYIERLNECIAFEITSVSAERKAELRAAVGDTTLAKSGIPGNICNAAGFNKAMMEVLAERSDGSINATGIEAMDELKGYLLLKAHQKAMNDIKEYIADDDERLKWQSVYDSKPISSRVKN